MMTSFHSQDCKFFCAQYAAKFLFTCMRDARAAGSTHSRFCTGKASSYTTPLRENLTTSTTTRVLLFHKWLYLIKQSYKFGLVFVGTIFEHHGRKFSGWTIKSGRTRHHTGGANSISLERLLKRQYLTQAKLNLDPRDSLSQRKG